MFGRVGASDVRKWDRRAWSFAIMGLAEAWVSLASITLASELAGQAQG
jgi:hypothetical protein